MSKLIAAVVLAVICHAVMAFICGANPSVTVSPMLAAMFGGMVGFLVG